MPCLFPRKKRKHAAILWAVGLCQPFVDLHSIKPKVEVPWCPSAWSAMFLLFPGIWWLGKACISLRDCLASKIVFACCSSCQHVWTLKAANIHIDIDILYNKYIFMILYKALKSKVLTAYLHCASRRTELSEAKQVFWWQLSLSRQRLRCTHVLRIKNTWRNTRSTHQIQRNVSWSQVARITKSTIAPPTE